MKDQFAEVPPGAVSGRVGRAVPARRSNPCDTRRVEDNAPYLFRPVVTNFQKPLRFGAVVLSLIATCAVGAGVASPALIPVPQTLELREGAFEIGPETRIRVDATARQTGEYLAARLRACTGYPLKVSTTSKMHVNKGEILLTTKDASSSRPEGYELNVAQDAVVIRAADATGLFYGTQSLLQLLPPECFASQPVRTKDWQVPCAHIQDQPRFAWRGLLLDVARHFFSKEEIKEVIDAMALHKLNVLQLHLTDDQGWRVPIKKYPRLTEVGAWRKGVDFGLDAKSALAYGPDGRYGGFYTRADIRELVAYARARHVTIVPEIEMPGHASAALTAYPQYSCSGGPYTTDTDGGIFAGVYCAGKDETFEFLQNVLSEVIDLFPGKYIHIGGDEVPKDNWKKCPLCQARMESNGLKTEHELQSYFVRRIEKYLNSRGRTLIGWSEIREGGLAQNAVVMDWIGGAVEAASAGHDVVMTPTKYCYFDYYQSTNHATEPRAIGGYLPLSQAYAFEPVPAELGADYRSHIIGAQGNLWTEYIPNLKQAQYMAFPRLCALAEVAWSPAGARSYDGFIERLKVHCRRFDQLGINYRRASVEGDKPRE